MNSRDTAALMALLALAACSSAPAPDSPPGDPVLAHGRQIAVDKCGACHAIGRSDRSRHRDAPAFRDLSRNYPVIALEESLVEGLMTGHPDMPEYQFTPEAAAAFIAYLQSIQTLPAPDENKP